MGGAERMLISLISHLNLDKFEICLVVIDSSSSPLIAELPSGIKTIFLNKKKISLAALSIVKVCFKEQPDIIFTNLSYLNLLMAILKPVLPEKSKIISRETSIISKNNMQYRYKFFWSILYRVFYRKLDVVVCQTRLMEEDLKERFSFPEENIRVIHNPIDIELVRRKSKFAVGGNNNGLKTVLPENTGNFKYTLIFVGGLRKEKNVDGLLRSITLTRNKNFAVKVIGAGKEEASLRRLATRLGVDDRVTFMGFCQNPYPYISSADALVVCSHYEGLPNVAFEALCLGTQVIATPAGDLSKMVSTHLSGIFVASSSGAQDISHAIDRWIESQPMFVKSDVIDDFATGTIVEKFEKLFLSVAS